MAFLESSDILSPMAGTEGDDSEVSTSGAGETGLVSFGDPVLFSSVAGATAECSGVSLSLPVLLQTASVLYHPMCGISNLSGDVTNKLCSPSLNCKGSTLRS